MRKRGSYDCPVCQGSMYPGDVVCLRCQSRVRLVKPQLLKDYANQDLAAPDIITTRTVLREQITLCAMQQLPARGRPQKGAAKP